MVTEKPKSTYVRKSKARLPPKANGRKQGGRPPSSWFGEILVERPEEAKAIFVRLMNEHAGVLTAVAAAIGCAPKRAFNLVYKFGLRGRAKEIRESQRARFRLPAA